MTALADLRSAVWALSTLRVAAERDVFSAIAGGASDVPALSRITGIAPRVLQAIIDVLSAYDLLTIDRHGMIALTEEGGGIAARGGGDGVRLDLSATFGQARAFVEEAGRGSDLSGGWCQVDAEVIRAQGRLSERMTAMAMQLSLGKVPELERIALEGAAFLDVGLGAAGGSIAVCRRFPKLRCVGLEPLPAARAAAREAIEAAGMTTRIEVRANRVEDLADERVYDVAFVASMFLDDKALSAGLGRVLHALKSGGVAILGAWSRPPDKRIASTSALRSQLWGGGIREGHDVARLAEAAGFAKTHVGSANGDLVTVFAMKVS